MSVVNSHIVIDFVLVSLGGWVLLLALILLKCCFKVNISLFIVAQFHVRETTIEEVVATGSALSSTLKVL